MGGNHAHCEASAGLDMMEVVVSLEMNESMKHNEGDEKGEMNSALTESCWPSSEGCFNYFELQ